MKSVLDHVLEHAARSPERVCVRRFSRRAPMACLTFGQVAHAAERSASFLFARGVRRGDFVALMGSHDLDFYGAWLGALWVGAIPSVLAEPSVRIDRAVYWSRLSRLLASMSARILIAPAFSLCDSEIPVGVPRHPYNDVAHGSGGAPGLVRVEPRQALLLQHSSGTTGVPKGVLLSHEAVSAQLDAYLERLRVTDDDVIASWLPLYHDMGLIACFVLPLVTATPVVWLSPFEWLTNPGLMLEAITTYRATLMWLPNFAFSFLSARQVRSDESYDLSSIRAAINCSEPVTARSMELFLQRFAASGLRPDALQASYGMAENVFAVTTSCSRTPPRRLVIQRERWEREHRAVPTSPGASASLVHVSSGTALPGCELRIAGPSGEELPARAAGRVLVRSPYLFGGYFGAEQGGGPFDVQGYFDTGDVGYVDDERHLYLTGRRKDLIIVGGRNVYPHVIEEVIGFVPGVRPGRVACFGVPRKLGTEGIVVLVESDAPEVAWEDLAVRVRGAVPSHFDLDVLDARVVKAGSLRKSTSGKVARAANRAWYLGGHLGAIPDSIERDEALDQC